MTAYSMIVMVHLVAGTVALTSFWCAALMRKGSLAHRRCGQVYLLAMTAAIVSGIPLVVKAAITGQSVTAMFLGFLLLLVSNSCWSAWRAVRDKGDFARFTGPVWRALNTATCVAGVALIITALLWWGPLSILLIAFGVLGLVIGRDALKLLRNGPDSPRWWMKEHYSAMIGNGAATHIAFFSIGLRRLVPDLPALVSTYLAWMVPLTAAFIATWWLNRRYGPRAVGATRPAMSADISK